MRVSNRVLSALLALFVVISTTVVDAQTQTTVEFPEAEVLAVDGAAVESVLAAAGLDAAWRSTVDLHPAVRVMKVNYRDDGDSTVAALLRTTMKLGAITAERDETTAEVRQAAVGLDDAFDEERRREINRNQADAYFRGIHALAQAVAIDVFAGEDPAATAILGLDGQALTVAQREFALTNTTLDEIFALRQQASDELDAAIEAYETAVDERIEAEERHAALVERVSELNVTRRELDSSARAILPDAAEAFTLGAIPGQTGLTAKALNAYLNAEATLAQVAPSCHVSWRTIAAVASVESVHGEYGGTRLDNDGRPVRPIVGIALNGQTVDNYGNTTANLSDTDNGRYDGDPNYDRAVGPLQFIPQTWQRWGQDGDGDGERDPQDIDDAALAAGAYLCNYGSLRSWETWSRAIFGYNHSAAYVNSVKASLDRVLPLRLPGFEGDELLRQPTPGGEWVPMPDPAAEPDPTENPDEIPAENPTENPTETPATTAPPPVTTAPPPADGPEFIEAAE